MPDFRQALSSGRVLLMDGAMGTELMRMGAKPSACFEACNLIQPEKIKAIHQSYMDAGAECILTNTFQSNPQNLKRHGLDHDMQIVNRRAIELAREAAGPDRFVIASIGPIDLSHRTGDLDATLQSLSEADAWLLETWSDGFETAVQRATDPTINTNKLPVLLSLTFNNRAELGKPPGLHPSGTSAREAAERAAAFPISALGANCGRDIGKSQLIEILNDIRTCTNLPLLARPNAGTPIERDGRLLFPHSPQEMAAWTPDLIEAGAKLIGGCCGTGADYVRAIRIRSRIQS